MLGCVISCRSLGLYVDPSVSFGLLVGRSLHWFVSSLADRLVPRLIGQLVCPSTGWSFGRYACFLVGLTVVSPPVGIEADLRNRLKTHTLDCLMRISVEGPELDHFDLMVQLCIGLH